MLSDNARKALNIATGSHQVGIGDEIANAIDSSGSGPADAVAAIGVTSNLSPLVPVAASISASNLTAAIPADPTKAEVDAGIDALKVKVITALGLKADNADVETLRTEVEARLDVIEAKIDLILVKLKAAALMSS